MVKLCIIIFSSMLAYTYAAVAIFPYEPKPAEFADQEGCYLSSLNRVLPYNEPYYPKGDNSCLEYLCESNNETQLFSCGAIGIPEECHLEYDYTLDYPDCCGKPVCPTTEAPCVKKPNSGAPRVIVTVSTGKPTAPSKKGPAVMMPEPCTETRPKIATCVAVTALA